LKCRTARNDRPDRDLTSVWSLSLTSPATPIPFQHEQPDARRSWLTLHVRLIAPPETTPEVLRVLDASPAVTHLCVNEQSARKPSGDVVSFDVAREGATSVLEDPRGFGLEQKGAIVVENLDISISESAIRAEEETPWRAGGCGGLAAAEAKRRRRNPALHHLPLFHDRGDHDRRHRSHA
jgi:hypothetical protein